MAWIGTMPGSTDLGPGQAARRKPTDDGWEGYHMVTAEEMAAKADVSSLATVATTGDYDDLVNKPSISGQANADWEATSGVEEILNKPTLGSAAAADISDFATSAQGAIADTAVQPGDLAAVATSGSYNDLDDKPTIPTTKRIETYLGNTDTGGNYTVTYATPFAVAPDVQPQIQSGTPSQVVRITSSTTTGFTVQVTQRSAVSLLGIEVLLAATTPVNNSSVSVLVTER